MKEQHFIYETTVKKQVEEPSIEVREENGQKIEIKRTVKKTILIKVAILRPDRKLFKAAEIFFAKSLAEYLKAGLLPYSLVAKRYANDGGPLSESDKTRLKTLGEESKILEKEFFANVVATNDDEKKKKQDLLIRINKINEEVSTIQNAYSDIYDSTAEIKSRNDTQEWWSMFLILIDEGQGYTPIFGTGNYDERIDKLEEFELLANPFYNEVIRRASYLISFWFAARNTVTKIDFETMEKLYLDTLSEYKIQEEPVEIKVSDVTAPVTAPVTPQV